MPDILQLKDFIITRLHVDWQTPTHPAEDEGSFSGDLTIDYEVLRNPEAQLSLALEFRVKLTPRDNDAAGYSIESEIVGLFDFPETMSDDQVQYLIRVNGGTILYGILRGQIALFTGSFPGGKYTLPAIYMQDVVRQVEAKRKKPKIKPAAKKKVSGRPAGAAKTKPKVAAKKAKSRLKKK